MPLDIGTYYTLGMAYASTSDSPQTTRGGEDQEASTPSFFSVFDLTWEMNQLPTYIAVDLNDWNYCRAGIKAVRHSAAKNKLNCGTLATSSGSMPEGLFRSYAVAVCDSRHFLFSYSVARRVIIVHIYTHIPRPRPPPSHPHHRLITHHNPSCARGSSVGNFYNLCS